WRKRTEGNAITLRVVVDTLSTERVEGLLVLVETNRVATVAKISFPFSDNVPDVTVHVRLEGQRTHKVSAIAKIRQGANGVFFGGSREITVTAAACDG